MQPSWMLRPGAATDHSLAVLPFAGFLSMLASPFILYWVYMYTRGDISAIQWSMGSRRAFKRHMEASTLNPRDADAHYQLGAAIGLRATAPITTIRLPFISGRLPTSMASR